MRITTLIKGAALTVALVLSGASADAAQCREAFVDDLSFSVCTVDPRVEDLRLFRTDPEGRNLGGFARLNAMLAQQGQTLGFAMNAGMYHEDRSPVGLYVEEGVEHAPAVARAGPGNFGLLPNGVFCVGENGARVIETLTYLQERPACRFATQSGPMLVIDGQLHPRFLPDSSTSFIRNGVGVDAQGQVHFAISNQRVRFHEIGRLFRDVLGTPQALYFDGKVSRLFAPQIGRNDFGFAPLGPMIGTVVPQER